MRSSVRKKMRIGSSKVRPMPSITFTKRLKYSVTETIGWTLMSLPMPSRKVNPYRNATK